MQQESLAVVEDGHEILSAPVESGDVATHEAPSKPPGVRQEEVAPGGGDDPSDPPSDEQPLDLASRDLDLG